MLHALGFSVGLYAFFRDENGKPRTKRFGVIRNFKKVELPGITTENRPL